MYLSINKSVKWFERKNSWGQINWAVVDAWSQAITQSNESVDTWCFICQIPVGNWQKCSNMVDIHEYTVILGGGWNVVWISQSGIIQVIPIGISVVLINNLTFGLHIWGHIEWVLRTWAWWVTILTVIKSSVACYTDGAVSVDYDHILIRSESKCDDEGADINRIILSSTSCLKSISQSNKGVDLSCLSGLVPCCDH